MNGLETDAREYGVCGVRWYATLAICPATGNFPDDAAVFGDGNRDGRNRLPGDQAPDLARNLLKRMSAITAASTNIAPLLVTNRRCARKTQ